MHNGRLPVVVLLLQHFSSLFTLYILLLHSHFVKDWAWICNDHRRYRRCAIEEHDTSQWDGYNAVFGHCLQYQYAFVVVNEC